MSKTNNIFGRWLTPEFIDKLNAADWWPKIVADEELFVGIREGYLNVYCKGDSMAKLTAGAGNSPPNAKVHWKYLLPGGDKKPPRIKNDYLALGPATAKKIGSEISSIDQIEQIKLYAQARFNTEDKNPPPSTREKELIQRYLANAKDVIDLEASISTKRTDDGNKLAGGDPSPLRSRLDKKMEVHGYKPKQNSHNKGRSIPRIDLIQLIEDHSKIHLNFVEVKHIQNSELRANRQNDVSVIKQLRIYEFLLTDTACQDNFISAYKKVCQTLVQLGIAKENSLARKVVENGVLDILPKPKLLILTNGSETSVNWEEHKARIQEAGYEVEEHQL